MRAGLMAAGSLGACMAFVACLLGTVALAQPRSARPAPAHSASSPTASSPSPTSAPAPSASDLGPVSAPPAAAGDGGKLSPLNPAPNEFADAALPAASIDYDRLLSDLAALRARAAAVSDVLFHSRIAVSVQGGGDHGRIAALSVALDDGVVWTAPSPGPFHADDPETVYEHAVAPGHHAVTVDVDRKDDRDETFRTAQRSRFVVDVPADSRLSFEIRLSDDSSMGAEFPGEKKGQYDLRVRAQAKASPLSQGK